MLGVVVQACNPALWVLRQEELKYHIKTTSKTKNTNKGKQVLLCGETGILMHSGWECKIV
jgi:hypothetical protein